MKSSKQSMMQQELFCSPEGFLDPANRSHAPGSKEAQMMIDISGRKCFELYQKQNQNGLLEKMCEGLLVTTTAWYSRIVVLTWKEKVTPSKRLLFQLAPSTPRTEGIGSGLLPTAQAADASMGAIIGKNDTFKVLPSGRLRKINQNGVGGSIGLSGQIAMLPTPKNRDYRSPDLNPNSTRQQKDSELNTAIAMLPTPRAGNDYRDTKMSPSSVAGKHGKSVAGVVASLCPTPRMNDYKGASKQYEKKGRNPMTNSCMDAVENGINRGLKLQPAFVEWMMGLPKNYTNLKLPTEWQD